MIKRERSPSFPFFFTPFFDFLSGRVRRSVSRECGVESQAAAASGDPLDGFH
jgi:hypothetical protein